MWRTPEFFFFFFHKNKIMKKYRTVVGVVYFSVARTDQFSPIGSRHVFAVKKITKIRKMQIREERPGVCYAASPCIVGSFVVSVSFFRGVVGHCSSRHQNDELVDFVQLYESVEIKPYSSYLG